MHPGDLRYIKVRRGAKLHCLLSSAEGVRPTPRQQVEVPGQAPIIYVCKSKLFTDMNTYYAPNGDFVEVIDMYVCKEPEP